MKIVAFFRRLILIQQLRTSCTRSIIQSIMEKMGKDATLFFRGIEKKTPFMDSMANMVLGKSTYEIQKVMNHLKPTKELFFYFLHNQMLRNFLELDVDNLPNQEWKIKKNDSLVPFYTSDMPAFTWSPGFNGPRARFAEKEGRLDVEIYSKVQLYFPLFPNLCPLIHQPNDQNLPPKEIATVVNAINSQLTQNAQQYIFSNQPDFKISKWTFEKWPECLDPQYTIYRFEKEGP